MTKVKDWRERLEQAARRLEATKAAPAWLAGAIRDSVADADLLARTAAPDAAPDDFFYPH